MRFVSRVDANPAFGAHANAEVTERGEQPARVEGRANTQPRMQDGGQNGYKARSDKENFVGESSVTGKPPRRLPEIKDLQAQKSHLSHYPLTRSLSARETALSENGGTRA